MKTVSILALLVSFAVSAMAQDKLGYTPADTVATVLQRQVGQMVELRLESGEKIGGKVQAVGDKTVHLSSLTGQEFYDAVVVLDHVTAVVVRNK